jgi:DNA polymerase I-like protein with 3'-5' exonuclease and polymerase domains
MLLDGTNFHDANAKVFFNLDAPSKEIKERYPTERKIAKELGLLLLYGGGKKRIRESAQKYGITLTEMEAQGMYETFRNTYQAVYSYKKQLDGKLEVGEVVTNLLGRKYTIPNPEDVYMKGFNTMIQSSASDLLLEWGARFLDLAPLAEPLLYVHDELIIHVPNEQATEYEQKLLSILDQFNLETVFGRIKLKAEGGIFNSWQKG